MKTFASKKILWLILVFLVTASVVLASIPIINKIKINQQIEQAQAELSEFERIKNDEGISALKTINDDFFAWLLCVCT